MRCEQHGSISGWLSQVGRCRYQTPGQQRVRRDGKNMIVPHPRSRSLLSSVHNNRLCPKRSAVSCVRQPKCSLRTKSSSSYAGRLDIYSVCEHCHSSSVKCSHPGMTPLNRVEERNRFRSGSKRDTASQAPLPCLPPARDLPEFWGSTLQCGA